MKVLVLGGGVIGVTTACYLAKDGPEAWRRFTDRTRPNGA